MSQAQSAFVYISGLTNSPFMRTVIPPTSKARKIQRHTKSPVHPTKCLIPAIWGCTGFDGDSEAG